MALKLVKPQIGANPCKMDRAQFWGYCKRAVGAARHRAKNKSLPFDLDAYAIDELLVSQRWCCAVSNMTLTAPASDSDYSRDPFSPSLDRIVPQLGYVRGNVRVICNMANFAINEWGLEALEALVDAMAAKRR